MKKLKASFYNRDCVTVASELVGKLLVANSKEYRITETEAYGGLEDSASHASKGRTKRTGVMFLEAGTIYVYLCYGIHHLFNIVTGKYDDPQAVLIRGIEGIYGPGRLTKHIGIDMQHNKKSILEDGFYLAQDDYFAKVASGERIGIGYAKIKDQRKLWRFYDTKLLLQRRYTHKK